MNLEKELVRIAYEAGEILRTQAFRVSSFEMKKDEDPVTALDRYVESYIKQEVREVYSPSFYGEEEGFEQGDSSQVWIIDPIDGTKAYLRGNFETSLSIAISDENYEVSNSCVYDFMRDIMYIGSNFDGNKILYRGEEVPISSPKGFEKSTLLVNREAERLIGNITGVKLKPVEGSIALNMARTATGVYDGICLYTPDKGEFWDIAAGLHLLESNDDMILRDQYGANTSFKDSDNSLIALNKRIANNLEGVIRND